MQKKFKKYIALPLEQVKAALNSQYNIKTIENYPPKQKQGQGQKRVISINEVTPNKIEIIWSCEHYLNNSSNFHNYYRNNSK